MEQESSVYQLYFVRHGVLVSLNNLLCLYIHTHIYVSMFHNRWSSIYVSISIICLLTFF